MKMSDVFKLPMVHGSIVLMSNDHRYVIEFDNTYSDIGDQIEHVAHAINNHDRMVEEIAELKASLREARGALSACSIQESRSDGSENRMKINALDKQVNEIDDLLAKLNQEGGG